MSEGVDLNTTSIDDLANFFSHVYAGVTVSDDPNFRWLNVIADVTILGEEIRRGESRKQDAIERAMKVLSRLLTFVGFYLTRKVNKKSKSFSNFFGEVLQMPSYAGYFRDRNSPPEGPSRWILAKYPRKCAKCAEAPCQCVLAPWIFEERRQRPSSYEGFREKAEAARGALKSEKLPTITLPLLFDFFNRIYRNTYYGHDLWKTAMHLSEEVGEVTAQLVRLQLLHRAVGRLSLLGKSSAQWGEIEAEANGRLNKVLYRIDNSDALKPILEEATRKDLSDAIDKARHSSSPAKHVAQLTGEKLKEEIADVFSWLSAVILQLSDGEARRAAYLQNLLQEQEYLQSVQGGQLELKCKWCGKTRCRDSCLINHGVAAELYEHVAKF